MLPYAWLEKFHKTAQTRPKHPFYIKKSMVYTVSLEETLHGDIRVPLKSRANPIIGTNFG